MSETKVVYERKVIQNPNLGTFIVEVAAAVADGWTYDEQYPPALYGYFYEANLLKDEKLIDKSPTRSDLAANARSAKKIKAEAKPAIPDAE